MNLWNGVSFLKYGKFQLLKNYCGLREQIWSQILVQEVLISEGSKSQEDLCFLGKFLKSVQSVTNKIKWENCQILRSARNFSPRSTRRCWIDFRNQMLGIYNGKRKIRLLIILFACSKNFFQIWKSITWEPLLLRTWN